MPGSVVRLAAVALAFCGSAVPAAAPDEEVRFEDLVRLTDAEVQTLLREVEQKDLVLALKGASPELRERLFVKISRRVRTFIIAEMEYVSAEEAATGQVVRQRILEQARGLALTGALGWPPGRRPQAGPATATAGAAAQPGAMTLKPAPEPWERLIGKPFARLSFQEMTELFAGLSEQARRQGILSLEQLVGEIGEPQLVEGLKLAVEGTEPDLIREMLQTELWSQVFYLRMRHAVVIEGLMSILSGDNPLSTDYKLAVIYASGTDGRTVHNPDLDDLRAHIVQLAEKARRQGLSALRGDAEGEPDELLKTGLYLVLDGRSPDLIIDLLEDRREALIRDYELRRKMIVEGIAAIQAGHLPEQVIEQLREVYSRDAAANRRDL